MIANKIVLPEATSRAKSNKINKEFGQKDTDANEQLNALFGKLKRKRCLHFWTKGKFITFHQDEYSNIFFEKNNLSKIIPTQVKFQIEKKNYIKNVFLIDKKGIYCFEKSENKSFIFFFNNRIYNYEK